MSFQQPTMDVAEAIQPKINVGATLDICTGSILYGTRNEAILTGGCPTTVGVVGMPNAFKSAFIHYLALTILDRITQSSGQTYDAESTLTEERIRNLSMYFEKLSVEDLFEFQRWLITNRSIYTADKWFDIIKAFMKERVKNKAKNLRNTPFMDRDKTPFKMLTPYVAELDSMSEFTTESDEKMQDENSLGEKGGLTIFMKQGLNKTRFMQEIPHLAVASNSYVLITAHLGKEIPMDPHAPPAKTLQYLRQGMKIKGAPPKFEYLTHLTWVATTAPPLITKDKTPLYPRDSEDNLVGDTDLVCVTMTILRNKNGPSGLQTQLIYSQQEGLLPSLTEFHYAKEHERFGLGGNDRNYFMDLLPDVTLSRTTVRRKLNDNPLLRRAVNITSEMCQMKNHWHHLEELYCTPAELRADLEAKGYDWNLLLNTRGYWVFSDQEDAELPFLSTLDLLRMRSDNPKYHYHPYWYPVKEEDLKK